MSNEFIDNLRKSANVTDKIEKTNKEPNSEILSKEEEYRKMVKDKFPWVADDIVDEKTTTHKLRELFNGNQREEEER